MKQVSFEVAKDIKEAGYPQGKTAKVYLLEDYGLFKKGLDVFNKLDNSYNKADIPTYLEVWLWLWKEKGIYIQVGREYCTLSFKWGDSCTFIMQATPEETIEKVIEYLVNNDLINYLK